jgi:hypothetical protein
VLAALRLRMPRLPIERHGATPPPEHPLVYVQIVRAGDTAGHLRVITSDGRAFERGFVVEVGQEVRVTASTVASLLFAIEQGAVAPDREDVSIPEAATPEPTPAEPTPVEPEPPPLPLVPETGPERPVPKNISIQPGRRWDVTIALHGAAVLGLGRQTYADALVGAGGGFGAELRGPRGATAALDLRGVGLADDGLGVGRLRIAVGGGYTVRRGRFELPIVLALSVEPWWATRAGEGAAIYSGSSAASRRPLLGGHLRLTPSARVMLGGKRTVALRVGPRLELGGSFVVDGGARIIGLADESGTPRFRLGGLELSMGLELALQLPAF